MVNLLTDDKQQDLNQIKKSLLETQRLAGIGTLTASVAHELTNPISIITATCNNLLSQVADENLSEDELLRYIEMIDYSAWRCARLIQTLRTYSHTNQGEKVSCELNQIVEDALILVQYQFERQHNIRIQTLLEQGLPPGTWDQNQITQILINLLTNARDTLDQEGGSITVKTWEVDENTQAFAIIDDGPGIPEDIIDKIFDPFFTTKPLGQGTGLGLSIVTEIVERHGGQVRAQNEPGGGANFTVFLPLIS